ncbi:M13 family metallopeptidase [Mucilaginibacter sp. HMF5004]|uniref:M13 family metallopeptidase n=1 Tax=Mucilaginibacter rivuli TaxID=2857527 RepID=UPI001C5EEBBD|nr:M13 family metallopeptidase [Mucilaginibacter rivuli]MBW4891955.1 M13 family metallopeptidase [Mucilaginibacter rivuli]
MKIKFCTLMLTGAVCLSANTFAGGGDKPAPKPVKNPIKYIDPANMDLSIKPGDDFFEYANGKWVKTHPIPSDKTRWGSFNILADGNNKKLIALLKEVSSAKGQPKGSLKQRVGDMFASGMDSVTIEKLGYTPIKADLDRVDKISNLTQVLDEIIAQRLNGTGGALFSVGVGQDSKHPNKNIVQFGQGGTTMPDRDYYLKSDGRSTKVQEAYKKYIATLFILTGSSADEAAKNTATIYEIEKKLATAQIDRVALRDPNKNYNKFTVPAFSKTTPSFNWVALLPKLKMGGQDSVIVAQPLFFVTVDELFKSTPVEDWKVYLKWQVLKGSASSLSSPFVNAAFAYSSAISGQKVQSPRVERMSSLVDGSLGELLGQLYVKKYFTAAAKQYMVNLVINLKVTLGDRIKRLDWMSSETKARALKKLAAFTVKIGYPDKWQTYDGLVIKRNDYVGNLKRVAIWRYNFSVSQLGKSVDKKRWGMTAPTVNASYSPTNNQITFPAGILQYPFFDFGADDAVNYGGIGVVIGHEMTHGFDDQGRQFDADGSLRDWWTKDDADKFVTRAQKVVEEFNGFNPVDTMHIKGKLTLGENLADLGGMNVAYEAFKKTKQGKSNVKINGFTPDQRFFLGFAQVWRESMRPEEAMSRILTDPHSPGKYRVLGTVVNLDAWYKAFDVKPGDKMYKAPEDRIKIW